MNKKSLEMMYNHLIEKGWAITNIDSEYLSFNIGALIDDRLIEFDIHNEEDRPIYIMNYRINSDSISFEEFRDFYNQFKKDVKRFFNTIINYM